MEEHTSLFQDRKHAGNELAEALRNYENTDTMVLAVPRGGVVVGYEVADTLGLELDVIVPRKIGAPGQPELAIGAVASWGDHDYILDQDAARLLGVTQEYIVQEVALQSQEVMRRLQAYRNTSEPPQVKGRTVIVVDDGIATGYTTRAAAIALRNLGASAITLAVPVAPPDSLDNLRSYFDQIVCLRTPYPFLAVGYWYVDFTQVSDEEVIALLDKARQRMG